MVLGTKCLNTRTYLSSRILGYHCSNSFKKIIHTNTSGGNSLIFRVNERNSFQAAPVSRTLSLPWEPGTAHHHPDVLKTPVWQYERARKSTSHEFSQILLIFSTTHIKLGMEIMNHSSISSI